MYVSDVYVHNQLLCGLDFFNTGEESSCNFSCSLSFLFLLFAFTFHAKSFGVALLALAWNTKSFSIDILVLCVCLYAKRFTNTILVFLRLRVTQKLCNCRSSFSTLFPSCHVFWDGLAKVAFEFFSNRCFKRF